MKGLGALGCQLIIAQVIYLHYVENTKTSTTLGNEYWTRGENTVSTLGEISGFLRRLLCPSCPPWVHSSCVRTCRLVPRSCRFGGRRALASWDPLVLGVGWDSPVGVLMVAARPGVVRPLVVPPVL